MPCPHLASSPHIIRSRGYKKSSPVLPSQASHSSLSSLVEESSSLESQHTDPTKQELCYTTTEVNSPETHLFDTMSAAQKKVTALDGMQELINYTFVDSEILWEALHVPGAMTAYRITGRNLSDGNKRLALLGDAIMESALLVRWYQTAASKGLSFS